MIWRSDLARRVPWWARVLAVYVVARAVSALVLVAVAQQQAENLWTSAAPSYVEYTGLMWDADWYRQIAEVGYPAQLPVGADGSVQQNAWAFYPLFPLLVRLVSRGTGAPWENAAPVVAIVLGAVAMLVIYRLIEAGAPRAVAARPGLPLATVAVVATFGSAVVLQVAYTESLALLLVAATLLALVRRNYAAAAALVLALGFTRAVALPMAVVVCAHAWSRWQAARHGQVAVGRRDVVSIVGVGAAAVVSSVAWPAVCAAVTGRTDGYLVTQAAWRARADVVPVLPWVDVATGLAGRWGPLLLVAVLLAVAAFATSAPARRLGVELVAWPLAYLAYLVGVVEPGSSLMRFLLLAFPLAAVTVGVVREPAGRRRGWLGAVLLAGTLAQLGWVWALWRLTPPSGWPP